MKLRVTRRELSVLHYPCIHIDVICSTVQDATWYYNITEGNPYKTESWILFSKKNQRSSHLFEVSSDYFTKYEWADLYGKFPNLRKWLYVDKRYQGDHFAHGFYADGTASNGSTLGFWTVFNNLEGYTGGPLRSDLVVDTNIYNCTLF